MFDSLVVQFVVLWAVIDPIGSIPVYLAKTVGLSPEDRRKIARNAILIAAGILLFFWCWDNGYLMQCKFHYRHSKLLEAWYYCFLH